MHGDIKPDNVFIDRVCRPGSSMTRCRSPLNELTGREKEGREGDGEVVYGEGKGGGRKVTRFRAVTKSSDFYNAEWISTFMRLSSISTRNDYRADDSNNWSRASI